MRRLSSALLASVSVVAFTLLLAGPLAAYTVVLKDGKTIIAKEKYRIENGKAIIILPSGERTAMDAREIDVRRTEEANRNNYGTAIVLEQSTKPSAPPPPPPPRQKSLSDLIANRDAAPRELPEARREGSAARAPGTSGSAGGGAARTRAGFVDLSTVSRRPYPHLEVASELQQFFRGQGLEEVGIYSGTQGDRPLVEVTTNSEASVFRALAIGSNALLHIRDRHPQRVE
ncbi:MAG TPA: hypothetical protein VEL74_02110, partial [Thermoanaerobaculia bacterium]|nr:hypothetical protein [Thermoanaerobaculia bacterium]